VSSCADHARVRLWQYRLLSASSPGAGTSPRPMRDRPGASATSPLPRPERSSWREARKRGAPSPWWWARPARSRLRWVLTGIIHSL
jgi:hypothetical protein